jgi:hypothetical protein
VEILLWLVPPVVVTVVAMLWVGWVGRDRRELDREEAVRRLGAALEKEPTVRRTPAARPRERSTGVAVRRTPRRVSAAPDEVVPPAADDSQRRAS